MSGRAPRPRPLPRRGVGGEAGLATARPAPPKEVDDKKKSAADQKKPEAGIQTVAQAISLDALQYHTNIVLPETWDQGVYDAIFRSLREHLGTRHG